VGNRRGCPDGQNQDPPNASTHGQPSSVVPARNLLPPRTDRGSVRPSRPARRNPIRDRPPRPDQPGRCRGRSPRPRLLAEHPPRGARTVILTRSASEGSGQASPARQGRRALACASGSPRSHGPPWECRPGRSASLGVGYAARTTRSVETAFPRGTVGTRGRRGAGEISQESRFFGRRVQNSAASKRASQGPGQASPARPRWRVGLACGNAGPA
jgi:hypothetical protein